MGVGAGGTADWGQPARARGIEKSNKPRRVADVMPWSFPGASALPPGPFSGYNMGMAASFIQRHTIWLAVGLSVLLSALGLSLYVDELFVTFLHEASHGLAAILTGGQLHRFIVSPDTSGRAFTSGGFAPLIVTAGYVGSCLWGGVLLVAARQRGWEKAVLFTLAAFFIGFTFLFVRNAFGFAVGLGWGAFFAWAGYHGKNWQLSMLLCFLAVQSSLYALKDLFSLVRLANTPVMTDAAIMSRMFSFGMVPPVVFALGISAIAVVVFLFFLRLALKGELVAAEGALAQRPSSRRS